MIAVEDLVENLKADLDAEGSDYYNFDNHYKPSINKALRWLVAVFNAAFEQKKLSGELLRDLNTIKVWQANAYSRISMDPDVLGHEVWSILGVFPEPEVFPKTSVGTPTEKWKSKLMDKLTYVGSEHSAERQTLEEWNMAKKNPFAPGNKVIDNPTLSEYAYLTHFDYNNNGYTAPVSEIEVTNCHHKLVAIAYVKYPTEITDESDEIGFPKQIEPLLTQKALNIISYRQGDQTNIYGITEKDIATLINIMV